MFVSSRRWLASAAFVALSGHFSGAQSPAAARSDVALRGCYRLTLGPWSNGSDLGTIKPTAVVRLDTIALRPGAPGDRVAERVELAEPAPPGDWRLRWRQPARWRRVDADSIVIVAWSTGTEAEVFYGRRVAGSLRGVLRRTTDAIPVDPRSRAIQWDVWPWAPASAILVPCP